MDKSFLHEAGFAPGMIEGRRALRRPLQLEAVLRNCSQGRFTAVICDISEYGCALRRTRPISVGSYLTLTIPSFMSLGGVTVWTDADHIGVRFIERLHVSVVDHLVTLHASSTEPIRTLGLENTPMTIAAAAPAVVHFTLSTLPRMVR